MKQKPDHITGETIEWLREQIEAFFDHNELTIEQFGWFSCGDSAIVTRLRQGGDVTTTKMDQILDFMKNPVSGPRSKLSLKPIQIKRRVLQ